MSSTDTNAETRIALSKALQTFEIFRGLSKDMPLGEAVSFIMVALGETKDGGGLSVTDLSNLADMELTTTSRYCQHLGELDKNREPGLGLISDHTDLMDRRKKYLRVSPNGRKVVQKIHHIYGV